MQKTRHDNPIHLLNFDIITAMNRIIFYALAFIFCGCNHLTHDDTKKNDYTLHDDYYYLTKTNKQLLTKSSDNYFLVIKTKYQDNVLAELENRNFKITVYPAQINFAIKTGYRIPETLTDCSVLCIQGDNSLEGISGIIYSNHLYYDTSHQLIGRSNVLVVKYENDGQQLCKLMDYAKLHNIHPTAEYPNLQLIIFACTNESSGNPVELANWFVEIGGFPMAQPEYGEDKID